MARNRSACATGCHLRLSANVSGQTANELPGRRREPASIARKLSRVEVVALKTVNEKGQSSVAIGRTLGGAAGSG